MTDAPNPLNRDAKTLKTQVRRFIKEIQHKLELAGLVCRLGSNVRMHEGKSTTFVTFAIGPETELTPVASIETALIFRDPLVAEEQVVKQIYQMMQYVQQQIEDAQPQDVII